MSLSTARRSSFREVFAQPEFRALWLSYVLSAAGDRLALVALTLLVYDRSKSPLLAADHVRGRLRALSVRRDVPVRPRRPAAPPLGHGHLRPDPLRPRGGDARARRAPRRDDRPALRGHAAPAAVRRVPLRDRPRHDGRRPLPPGHGRDGLDDPRGGRGGLGRGRPHRGAVRRPARPRRGRRHLHRLGLAYPVRRARPPAAAPRAKAARTRWASSPTGVRLVFGDPALRTLLGLGWLAAFYEVPEGLAAPYAGRLGGGAVAAGLLLATSQLGAAVSTPLFTKKIGPLTRLRWMGPMAVVDLRNPRGDDPSPEPGRLDGTVRAVQQLRDVPDRRQHRVRGADTRTRSGGRRSASPMRAWSSVKGWRSR